MRRIDTELRLLFSLVNRQVERLKVLEITIAEYSPVKALELELGHVSLDLDTLDFNGLIDDSDELLTIAERNSLESQATKNLLDISYTCTAYLAPASSTEVI